MRPILLMLSFCILYINSFCQSAYEIDSDFLKSIDGKYFAFSYYDETKERPYGLIFQLKYEAKDSSFVIRNLSALSKWYGTSYKGKLLTLTKIDTTYLLFNGVLQAKYKDGDTQDVDCELKIYLFSSTDEFQTWLTLPAHETVWGYTKMGTQATAQKIYDENIHKQPVVAAKQQLAPVELSDELSVITYLNGKRFKSSSGTVVSIGYSSELGSYGVMFNGRAKVFNLTYTPITKYKATVEGIVLSTEDGGNIKIFVNSMFHILEIGGTLHYLQ